MKATVHNWSELLAANSVHQGLIIIINPQCDAKAPECFYEYSIYCWGAGVCHLHVQDHCKTYFVCERRFYDPLNDLHDLSWMVPIDGIIVIVSTDKHGIVCSALLAVMRSITIQCVLV